MTTTGTGCGGSGGWRLRADVVVIGTGVAGLAAALAAHRRGSRVMLLSKAAETATFYAQGGIAVVLPDSVKGSDDSVDAHVADTLVAGAGLAVVGAAVGIAVVVQQGGGLRVDGDDDIAAIAPIAAVGPAEGLELLAANRGDTMAAFARGDVQQHAVDEGGHHGLFKGIACGENTNWGEPFGPPQVREHVCRE